MLQYVAMRLKVETAIKAIIKERIYTQFSTKLGTAAKECDTECTQFPAGRVLVMKYKC